MSGAPACFIGLDMGTTNTRAWLVVDGRIAATARASVGIRDAAVAGSAALLHSTVARLVLDLGSEAPPGTAPRCIVAAGMITSAQGLAEVPHVAAPAKTTGKG